jgi:hypothetical protein
MILRPAWTGALLLTATACGNLARDVIIEKASPLEAGARPEPGDADPSRFDKFDAGAYRHTTNTDYTRRCDRDGGCWKKIEESCNKYHCEDWCQNVCSSIASAECREKVHCRQTSSRQGLP